jgi:hypothetical protein
MEALVLDPAFPRPLLFIRPSHLSLSTLRRQVEEWILFQRISVFISAELAAVSVSCPVHLFINHCF